MGEIRFLARAPLAIFERFVQQMEATARDTALSATSGVARVREFREGMQHELVESLRQFRQKLGEVEPRLLALRHPPRLDIHRAIQEANERLNRLMVLAARREELIRGWEDMDPEAILTGYSEALQRGEHDVVEIYEVDAEAVLRRKGNGEALKGFLAIRAIAEEQRLTPSQKQAQAHLEELEGLKQSARVASHIVAITLNVSGEFVAKAAGWRQEGRVAVEPAKRAQTLVLVLPGATPAMTASLVDASHSGLQLDLPSPADVGNVLNLIVKNPDAAHGEIRLQGEVRWCQPHAARYRAGVQIAPPVPEQWVTFLTWLAGARHQRDSHAGERGSSQGAVPASTVGFGTLVGRA